MRNARKNFQVIQQRVAYSNRSRFIGSIIIEVRDLDMRAETDHLIPDLLLKTNDYSHRKDHDSQSQGYSDHSNTNNRRSSLPVSLFAEIDTFCYKIL